MRLRWQHPFKHRILLKSVHLKSLTFFNIAIELLFLLHSRICGTIWYFQVKVYWAQGTKCLIEKGLA